MGRTRPSATPSGLTEGAWWVGSVGSVLENYRLVDNLGKLFAGVLIFKISSLKHAVRSK